jgi:DNA repair exonuclease SbcCD ATPase subunit
MKLGWWLFRRIATGRAMTADDDMSNTLGKLGNNLINAVLGGLILWVGQTAIRHEGTLAGVDEQIAAVDHKFEDVDKRQESMRKWLESVVNDLKDSNRAQFTLKDGDKLVAQVRQAEQSAAELERRFAERLNQLDVKLAALETGHRGSQEIATLQMEVAQLRNELARAAFVQQMRAQTDERVARGVPVFLPPVDSRR